MKQIILEARSPKTIHDVHFETPRVVKFISGTKYAILVPAYFGGSQTTHRSIEAVCREARKLDRLGMSYKIMDDEHNFYIVHENGKRLVKTHEN
jgi:hypothetical protein